MNNKKIIRNYTTALFEKAKEYKLEDKILQQIIIINDFFLNNLDINVAMLSPIVEKDYKIQIVKSIVKKNNIEVILESFLLLVVEKSRSFIFPYIEPLYRRLLDESRNIKVVQITSAKELKLKEQEWVKNYLESELKQEVRINFNSDQSIIGGIIIQYDSIVRDYSIIGVLEQVRENLNSEKVKLFI